MPDCIKEITGGTNVLGKQFVCPTFLESGLYILKIHGSYHYSKTVIDFWIVWACVCDGVGGEIVVNKHALTELQSES